METRVYRSNDGQWIFWDGTTKTFFTLKSEAILMSDKIQFAEKTIDLSEILIGVVKEFPSLEKIWALEDYLTTMTDPDIASTGKTKAEVTAFVTFIGNFQLFLSGSTSGPPYVEAEYRDTLYNLLRGP